MEKRNQKKNNFSARIIFITLVVSLVSGVLVGAVGVRYMQDYTVSQRRQHAKSMAQIAAEALDGDMLEQIGEGDTWSPEYKYVYYQLSSFLADEDVYYIYTLRQEGDKVTFIVDADKDSPAGIGTELESYDKIDNAFAGQITLDDHPTEDQWGKYYSAFAPIRNSEGRVVAIVGVDATVKGINNRVHAMVRSLILIEAICIVATTVLSIVAAKRMTQYVEEASKDGLTGMYNRRYAVRYIDEIDREGESYGFLLLDIDYFKNVNDTYGHRVGDSVLVGLATVLQHRLGPGDIGFRLGGDEFALFFTGNVTEQQLLEIARRIKEEFAHVAHTYCPNITTGVSLGGLIGTGNVPFGALYHNADQLLYEVKENGRGGCRVKRLDFDPQNSDY